MRAHVEHLYKRMRNRLHRPKGKGEGRSSSQLYGRVCCCCCWDWLPNCVAVCSHSWRKITRLRADRGLGMVAVQMCVEYYSAAKLPLGMVWRAKCHECMLQNGTLLPCYAASFERAYRSPCCPACTKLSSAALSSSDLCFYWGEDADAGRRVAPSSTAWISCAGRAGTITMGVYSVVN